MGEKKNTYRVLVGRSKGDNMEELGIDGRILNWILEE
jgi:hypothetical protein